MITVSVWEPHEDSPLGHASMRVGDAYISWWPESQGRVHSKIIPIIYHARPIRGQNFRADVGGENGRMPDHVINISGLDEDAIKQWWETLSLTREGVLLVGPLLSWHTLQRNCSTVVAAGLKVGGGDRHASWATSHNLVWTPRGVRDFALSILSGLSGSRAASPGGSANRR